MHPTPAVEWARRRRGAIDAVDGSEFGPRAPGQPNGPHGDLVLAGVIAKGPVAELTAKHTSPSSPSNLPLMRIGYCTTGSPILLARSKVSVLLATSVVQALTGEARKAYVSRWFLELKWAGQSFEAVADVGTA